MNRNQLIAIATQCDGEYDKIVKLINDNNSDISYNDMSDVKAITIFDDTYPKELLELSMPPFVLFYDGDINLLKKKKVGVVGTRNPGDYAQKATKDLVQKLNKENKVVVSGFAKGIDTIAHQNANETIAVLGCGIQRVYPQVNLSLYENLISKEGGLIISEYPFTVKPLAEHFPFRNRIIAALSKEVYIMEMESPRSGTGSLVNNALELGREINVLPFDAYSNNYNNSLIYSGTGIIKF